MSEKYTHKETEWGTKGTLRKARQAIGYNKRRLGREASTWEMISEHN
jgi:hypothetical protein